MPSSLSLNEFEKSEEDLCDSIKTFIESLDGMECERLLNMEDEAAGGAQKEKRRKGKGPRVTKWKFLWSPLKVTA